VKTAEEAAVQDQQTSQANAALELKLLEAHQRTAKTAEEAEASNNRASRLNVNLQLMEHAAEKASVQLQEASRANSTLRMRIFSAHQSMEKTSVHNQSASQSNATLQMRIFQQHIASQDDISKLEQGKRESEDQLSQLGEAAKQLRADKGKLQSELDRMIGEDGTVTRLENKIRDLRVEIRNLESTLTEKDTQTSELQLQLKPPVPSLDDVSLKNRNRGMRSPETGSRLLVLQTLEGDIGSNFAVGPDILDSLYQTLLLYKDGFEDNYQKYKRQPPRNKASWQCLREILCDGHHLAEEISGIRRCRTCKETRNTCLQVRNVQGETVLRAFPQASDMGLGDGDVFT
jgi:hypothetical protein